ncbi:hypothetical protein [Cupriavidus sp. PET2-C1]
MTSRTPSTLSRAVSTLRDSVGQHISGTDNSVDRLLTVAEPDSDPDALHPHPEDAQASLIDHSCGRWLQSHNRLQADRVFGDRLTSMTADDAAWPSRCQVKKKTNICLQYY